MWKTLSLVGVVCVAEAETFLEIIKLLIAKLLLTYNSSSNAASLTSTVGGKTKSRFALLISAPALASSAKFELITRVYLTVFCCIVSTCGALPAIAVIES